MNFICFGRIAPSIILIRSRTKGQPISPDPVKRGVNPTTARGEMGQPDTGATKSENNKVKNVAHNHEHDERKWDPRVGHICGLKKQYNLLDLRFWENGRVKVI